MRKPLRVISLRRRKNRLGEPLAKVYPSKPPLLPRDRRTQARRRRLAGCLCVLILAAVLVLCRAGYLRFGEQGFHRSRLLRTAKLFIASKPDSEQAEAVKFIQEALEQRTALLLAGDIEEIMDKYDLDSSTGTWAYENEVNRNAYLKKWALARNVRMVEAISTFEVDSVSKEGDGCYWIELAEHTRYAYEYPQSNPFEPTWALGASIGPWAAAMFPGRFGVEMYHEPPVGHANYGSTPGMFSVPVSGEAPVRHEFGSRTVHVIEVINTDGGWKIRKDWYMDPLGNNVTEPGQGSGVFVPFDALITATGSEADAGCLGEVSHAASARTGGQFDREKALRYAVKHSGVRALPEGGKYNPKYKIYTFAGGDCANFASQVLHAGGIPMGGGWNYIKEGTTAWVQSESLVWHLLSSGTGYRLFRGTFSEAGSGIQPESAAGQLEPGDIIAYEKKGQLYHVAVVAGKDPRGYVTIVSHTADRLYFPWDLGWDDSTVFWFIKITY